MSYLVLDTETTNSIEEPLMYDIGWSIWSDDGVFLKAQSFVVAEVYVDLREQMASAYYASKLPQYEEDILSGERVLAPLELIRLALDADCKMYGVRAIVAHNAAFDYRACATTIRYITKSERRYFFPYGVEIWDTMRMARQTIAKEHGYYGFCLDNDYLTKRGTVRVTAEILYRYLSDNLDFVEAHTGLEDTMIESQILFRCLSINPLCEKSPWKE